MQRFPFTPLSLHFFRHHGLEHSLPEVGDPCRVSYLPIFIGPLDSSYPDRSYSDRLLRQRTSIINVHLTVEPAVGHHRGLP